MPWFEIIYAEDPTGRALHVQTVTARDRREAAKEAVTGFASAQANHGATCYRVIDGLGMVVARSASKTLLRNNVLDGSPRSANSG